MPSPVFFFNGINGETGEYLYSPATLEQLAVHACPEPVSDENVYDAQLLRRSGKQKGFRTGDALDLGQVGWGVIFAADDPQAPEVYKALKDLLELRRAQVGLREHYYRELIGEQGYKKGMTKREFLKSHGVGPGWVDPEFMPYYLLLIGSPEFIPYELQYELDMQYAVGRLWFETVEEYGRYAKNVLAVETSSRLGARSAAFFAPQHPDDGATKLSATQLAEPLARRAAAARPDWTVRTAIGADATKDRLRGFLGGHETPDFLFTAGHGMVYTSGHSRQVAHQGALLCQDWPGPYHWHGRVPTDFFFSGDDMHEKEVPGLISFHFACYSAGAPAWSDFLPKRPRMTVAPQPFLACLPQRLLQAGALAVIGHIETAWECSIDWHGVGPRIQAFEDAVCRLLRGHPVGSAMEPFGQRYADVSLDLSSELQEMVDGRVVDDKRLLELWTDSRDARNYLVLGDPAVRLVQRENAQ